LNKISKNLGLILVAISVAGLAACSSKPSPWSEQSSSPWASRDAGAEPAEPAPVEEQSPFVDQAASNDAMVIEPVPEMPMEPEPLPTGPEMVETQPAMEVEPMPMESMESTDGDIASQPPGYFTVQLVASSNMKNLNAFVERHGLSSRWVAETIVDGKNWFILLSGVYPTREEAGAALADARATLDTSPWIRSVGSVQAVMIK
jgi:DamX protein